MYLVCLASLPCIFSHRSSSSLEGRLQPPEPTFACSVDGLGVCLFGNWPGIILLSLPTCWAVWEGRAYTKAVVCTRRKSSAVCRLEICQIGLYHGTTGLSWQLLILPVNISVMVQNALIFKYVHHEGKTM